MTNAEVIIGLRECATVGDCSKCKMHDEYSYDMCAIKLLLAAADALEADEKRIAELEDDLRNGTISDPEHFWIYGYSLKDLIMFAEMCKRNNVRDADLKQAAWNLEFAIRAVMDEVYAILRRSI